MSRGHGYKYQCRIHGEKCPIHNMRINPTIIALNLGCGTNKKESDFDTKWINLDSAKECSPDVLCNVGEERLPFKKDTFNFVYSHHSLEHFVNLSSVIDELYRVSKNGAIWDVTVPFGVCWQDNINHVTMGWNFDSWHKYVSQSRPYYSKTKLQLISARGRAGGLMRLLPLKRFLSRFLNNVYGEINYKLRVEKK